MRICISHRLTIICAPKWGFSGFCGWRCENSVFWPPKGTTLREYASADVSHVKIGSTAWALGRWKNFAYKEEIYKNWVVTLAIWGEVTPGATLTVCGVWGDMVDIITCAIFGDCRLRGVGVVRGANSPSPIDLMRRPYNTGHTTVWSCDSCLVPFSSFLTLNNIVNLKSGLEVTQCHWNWCHSKAWVRFPIRLL